jgi:molybdopterin molybdotransferase
MPEFLRLVSPSEALARLLARLPEGRRVEPEAIPTSEAVGRVLAAPVVAPHALPAFPRSTVDGFAVRAADTHGASPSLPAYLQVVGEVPMGRASDLKLSPGQAALVHTGGMVPDSADAVVMLEDTQSPRPGEIEVLKPSASGQNVIAAGEDVSPGESVLEAGVHLRPQEIGGLMALGIAEVRVARRPRVGILSSGDEVVDPESTPGPAQVRDVNSYALSALVVEAGGEPIRHGIVPDQMGALQEAARKALGVSDLVVITAGSSASARDLTAEAIRSLGEPGVLVHGVAIRPGKPTILAVADEVPVIGLPGNPVSALVIARLFVVPVIRRLLGERGPALPARWMARLSANIASEAGREDYIPVRLVVTPEGLVAEPVYGRSNLIFTLVRADGLIRIAPEVTGLSAGAAVEVTPF